MVRASLYILVRSTRNRIVARLRRLREPRYAIGAVFGAAYIYFVLFGPRRAAGRRGGRGRPIPAGPAALLAAIASPLAGAAVLLMAALAWMFPGTSSVLTFTEAET